MLGLQAKRMVILLSILTIATVSYTQQAHITDLELGTYMTICGFSGLILATFLLLGD